MMHISILAFIQVFWNMRMRQDTLLSIAYNTPTHPGCPDLRRRPPLRSCLFLGPCGRQPGALIHLQPSNLADVVPAAWLKRKAGTRCAMRDKGTLYARGFGEGALAGPKNRRQST